MTYKIEFQYKSSENSRPEDVIQDEEIKFDSGQFIPVPNVGDSVAYGYNGQLENFKVLSRHFVYHHNWCSVTIVVTDISDEDMAPRLKM